MEDLHVPVYIFNNSILLAMGDGVICLIKGKFYGSFDFDVVQMSQELDKITFPMCVIYGADTTHYSIGDVEFTRRGKEFVGSLEFLDDDFLHQIMHDVRSVTNIG